MKKLQYIFILTCLFLTFEGKAQEEISLIPKDTVKVVIDPNRPARAAFYSALVPGLGQVYNKKYWKVPIIYGGLWISIGSYLDQNNKYQQFRDEYKRRLDGTSDPNHPLFGRLDDDRLIRSQKFHQKNRDLSALITGFIYILNIVDANIDAHLMQFNVNDNLSIKPDMNQNQIDYQFNYGMTLTYRF